MEIWDAYDKNYQKIDDVSLIRGEKIPLGMYHLVSEILVKHTDNTYLIMQRDSKKNFGNMWEATAGGSALKGETAIQCAKRELFEETGILGFEFNELGIVYDTNTIYVQYLCVVSCEKDSIKLQVGETIDYKWITKEELLSMNKTELVTTHIQKFI